ncbi:MAG: transposase [Deltaproteobacteria bacterium]|nr:transposase [Deltaproteobacteria bacterium]
MVEVRGANVHDSVFFILFLTILLGCGVKVAKLLLDAAFTRQADYEIAKIVDVKVYSPVKVIHRRTRPSDEAADRGRNRMPLDLFDRDSERRITACPHGNVARSTFVETEKGRKYRAEFCREGCAACPRSGDCRSRLLKGSAVLNYTWQAMGLAVRRTFQKTLEWIMTYRPRAGVERTVEILQWLVFRSGRIPVRGLERVTYRMKLAGNVLNFRRVQQFKQCRAAVRK